MGFLFVITNNRYTFASSFHPHLQSEYSVICVGELLNQFLLFFLPSFNSLINKLIKMSEMTNVVATGNRAEMAKTFGMWTSKNASASDLVSWADGRIAIYRNWIENLSKLKEENQLKLVDGFSIQQLEAMIEAKRQAD